MKNTLIRTVAICMVLSLVALSIIPAVQVTAQSKPENDSTVILEKKDLRILIMAKLLSSDIEEKALIQTIINQISVRGSITQQNLLELCKMTGWTLFNGEFEIYDGVFFIYPGLVSSFFIGYTGPVAYGRWNKGGYLENVCNGFFIGGFVCGRQGFYESARYQLWFSNLQGQCRVGFYKVVDW